MIDKVVVLTKAKPFEKEEYVDVFSSIKVLEKHLRISISPYLKKDGEGQYHIEENGVTALYFAHQTIVKG